MKKEKRWLPSGWKPAVIAGILAGAIMYGLTMSVRPVQVRSESEPAVATEMWIVNFTKDYFGRRVPKQAERYKSKAGQLLSGDENSSD